jgi:hypothetical protein
MPGPCPAGGVRQCFFYVCSHKVLTSAGLSVGRLPNRPHLVAHESNRRRMPSSSVRSGCGSKGAFLSPPGATLRSAFKSGRFLGRSLAKEALYVVGNRANTGHAIATEFAKVRAR